MPPAQLAVRCRACGRGFAAQRHLFGTHVPCPVCGCAIDVPDPTRPELFATSGSPAPDPGSATNFTRFVAEEIDAEAARAAAAAAAAEAPEPEPYFPRYLRRSRLLEEPRRADFSHTFAEFLMVIVATAAAAVLTTVLPNVPELNIVLVATCWLVSALGRLFLLIVAFQAGILHGFGMLFVPFYETIFTLLNWEEAKTPYTMHLGGGVVFWAILIQHWEPIAERFFA